MTLETGDLLLRIALAIGLGGALGLEREMSDQPAGFRTHILVSLGAALFTLTGAYGVEAFVGEAQVRFDPTRVAAQVVTGIGFLGAGAIIQQGASVRGLTTAASLWVTAAVGTAVGLGYLTGAIAATGAALLALVVFKELERVIFGHFRGNRSRLTIDTTSDFRIGELTNIVEDADGSVERLRIYDEEAEGLRIVALVRVPARPVARQIATQLEEHDAVKRVVVGN